MAANEPRKVGFRRLVALSSIGLVLPSSIAVGLFFGYFLDSILGTAPWMLLIFFILGVVSGFLSLFRALGKLKDDDGNADSGV